MTPARSITLAALLSCLVPGSVFAVGLNDLTDQDASRGIKGALTEGASSAIAKLGVPGGFSSNPRVKIPLPPALDQIAKGMRLIAEYFYGGGRTQHDSRHRVAADTGHGDGDDQQQAD